MEKLKLSNSTRKFIRKEKARFRKNVSDAKEREKLISALYQRFIKVKSINLNEDRKQKVSAAG